MQISEMQKKIHKKSSVFQVIPFEVVAEISAYSGSNTCHRRSMCYQTVLRFMNTVKQSFSNWLYLEFMGKNDNSDALLLSAVFGTR